jgi:cation transport ATPase
MENLKTKIFDTIGLGIGLWLIGYIASMILFFIIPNNLLGWVLFVIFTPITLYIAYLRFRKRKESMSYYLVIASIWTIIAIILDYIFIVTLFNNPNYYKLDIFVYYITTFIIPLLIGYIFGRKSKK